MGGGGDNYQPPAPAPPSPEQTAYDKLQRDKAIRRASYLAHGMPDPYPGVVLTDSVSPTVQTQRGSVLGQSEEEEVAAPNRRSYYSYPNREG